MRRLTKSGTGLIVGLWLAFAPLWFLLPRDSLFEVLNGLCAAVFMGVVVAFGRGVWEILAIRWTSWKASDVLVLGIFVIAIGVVGTFVCLWLYRITGSTSFSNSPISAGFRWIIVTGSIMILVASGSDDGRIPPRAYRQAGIFVALGLALTTILMSIGF